ncbi:uncharacterized protein V1518DRAFT_376771 [Limtongia smithiae]|uniref:uncharacterized protein n=1 Tax=Limtongia smithiae TaxID=1125753 RepID=UPI0034CFA73A
MVPAECASQLPQGMPSVVRKKYTTSTDERNYLTVFEYTVNEQVIMWDFFSGYVHLTGLWKAIGNTKADIVRLVDNSPDLENVIRRVRGGFLKIQGTWLPYDIARMLAVRTCYNIRYALIPLFGADFPASCLKPGTPGFGQLQLTDNEPTRRRRRRPASTQEIDGVNGPVQRRARISSPEQPRQGLSPLHSNRKLPSSTEQANTQLPSPASSSPLQAPTPSPHMQLLDASSSPEVAHAHLRRTASASNYQHRRNGSENRVNLDFLRDASLASSPQDLLCALQATSSLKLLSSGWSPRQRPRTQPYMYPYGGRHDSDSSSDNEEGEEQDPCVLQYHDNMYYWDGKDTLQSLPPAEAELLKLADNTRMQQQQQQHEDQPRRMPSMDDARGLLGFAQVAGEEAQREERSAVTPGLSEGSASPGENMMRALSEGFAMQMPFPPAELPQQRSPTRNKEDVRSLMNIHGLLS